MILFLIEFGHYNINSSRIVILSIAGCGIILKFNDS
jgi:hypothetical protein